MNFYTNTTIYEEILSDDQTWVEPGLNPGWKPGYGFNVANPNPGSGLLFSTRVYLGWTQWLSYLVLPRADDFWDVLNCEALFHILKPIILITKYLRADSLLFQGRFEMLWLTCH
jgi:hypothetical protein